MGVIEVYRYDGTFTLHDSSEQTGAVSAEKLREEHEAGSAADSPAWYSVRRALSYTSRHVRCMSKMYFLPETYKSALSIAVQARCLSVCSYQRRFSIRFKGRIFLSSVLQIELPINFKSKSTREFIEKKQ